MGEKRAREQEATDSCSLGQNNILWQPDEHSEPFTPFSFLFFFLSLFSRSLVCVCFPSAPRTAVCMLAGVGQDMFSCCCCCCDDVPLSQPGLRWKKGLTIHLLNESVLSAGVPLGRVLSPVLLFDTSCCTWAFAAAPVTVTSTSFKKGACRDPLTRTES